jgi:N-acetylglucosamine kinase-like BadF-type ATPase
MPCVLGVDAGGTKTLAAVADEQGLVRGVGLAGSANYQGCGARAAQAELGRAVEQALDRAGLASAELAAACFGVAGADRPTDFAVIRGLLEPLAPVPRLRLENDTIVALRAGTPDGVGIALIAGTGANAIGRDRAGRTLQVGGLGRWSGDHGSAGQLGEAALAAAFMGEDGRGPPSLLAGRIRAKLGLERLEDIIEFGFYDLPRVPLDPGALAPLVFEAAAQGDGPALAILRQAGAEVARSVRALCERLFPGPGAVTVVFGGSVYQRGAYPTLIEAIIQATRQHRPDARFVLLQAEPVLGALEFALDDAGLSRPEEGARRLRASLRLALERARLEEEAR